MRTCVLMALSLAVMSVAQAQDCALQRLTSSTLGFEFEAVNGIPGGWGGTPGSVFVDLTQKHGGRQSLRIERDSTNERSFSFVARSIPVPSGAKIVELRGWLRAADGGVPKLWMRQSGEKASVVFIELNDAEQVSDKWTRYSVHMKVMPESRSLIVGVSFASSGTGWADDLELLVDGKPIEGTGPHIVESPLIRDHGLDGGSHFAMTSVSDAQLDALVLTGKVWGFLKYHHPAITAGKRHWDFDLLRKLPKITVAQRPKDVRKLLVEWIDSLGPVAQQPQPIATAEFQLKPDLAWIGDETLLGKDLSERLRAIYRSRAAGRQNFVCLSPTAGNPLLGDEPSYAQVKYPDSGFQILAIYRFWNVIQYWFPYRDLIDEKWDDVLRDSLSKASASMETIAFQREMLALVARADDGHANLWSAWAMREPAGACQLPVSLRYVEGKFVVRALLADDENARRFKPGDVFASLDDVAVTDIVRRVSRYYGASNESARMSQIARSLTRGVCGSARVEVIRDGVQAFEVERVALPPTQLVADDSNDRAGETFQMVAPEVAYLKLSTIRSADIVGYIENAKSAKALIVDIRNYPSDYVVFALGSLLVDKPTPFATFTKPDLSNPGAYRWGMSPSLTPAEPHFAGRVAILVDETSMSQAEYTAMALRASPRAIVVGMQTSGADGDMTPISLPGGLRAMMSGLGVFYPDRSPTQQVGVKLDVKCPNTIAGLREGRDETLDCALRELTKTP